MLTIDLQSPTPLVEQIYHGLRRAIAKRELQVDDPLPTVRQLAGDLGISLNTISRAYQMLESQGLIATVRGRGTLVTANRESPPPPKERALARIAGEIQNSLADALLAGLTQRQFETVVAKETRAFWKD